MELLKRFVNWYENKARVYGFNHASEWTGENVKDMFKNARK